MGAGPMTTSEVLFETIGYAGLITLNRPQALNALTLPMVEAMTAILRRWAADDAVRHVVIRASGDKAFSAGGDIRALHDWGRAQDPKVHHQTFIGRMPQFLPDESFSLRPDRTHIGCHQRPASFRKQSGLRIENPPEPQ